MTDVIASLPTSGQRVLTYPVNEGDYLDVGQWEEYHKAVDRIGGRGPGDAWRPRPAGKGA